MWNQLCPIKLQTEFRQLVFNTCRAIASHLQQQYSGKDVELPLEPGSGFRLDSFWTDVRLPVLHFHIFVVHDYRFSLELEQWSPREVSDADQRL